MRIGPAAAADDDAQNGGDRCAGAQSWQTPQDYNAGYPVLRVG
ncbi:MAG: hypothetical protein ACLUI3_11480 [Christensenellales bacterium]